MVEFEYLTVTEAAAILKVAPNTIRDWLKSGKLKGKIGRLWRIKRATLTNWLQGKVIDLWPGR